MPSLPDYRQAEDWFSLLEVAANSPIESLEELCQYARKKWHGSDEPGWVVPLGYSLWRLTSYKEAVEVLKSAPTLERKSVDYNIVLGMVARRVPGEELVAKKAYSSALKIDPTRADVYYNLGNLIRKNHPDQAERAYIISLEKDNKAYLTWHNLGLALNEQDRHDEAINALRKALLLNPTHSDGWCNTGLAYFGKDNFPLAIRFFRYAIELDSQSEASHVNLGYALMNEERPHEALQYLKKGIEISSGSVNAIWNLSLIELLLGNFKEGWNLYEARFDTEQFKDTVYPTVGPKIDSFDELPHEGDEPIVIWSEQGMGDAIQFCRYLFLLEARDIPFIFVARKMLFTLMKKWLPFSDKVVLEKSWDPETDKRSNLALMSLPKLFQTDLHTIPCAIPYLHPSEPVPEELRFDKAAGGISIGITWASNPDNKSMYKNKTMPAKLLVPHLIELLELDLIDLHSLQVGPDADQLDAWSNNERLINWNGRLNDFSDTAHVIQQLDLVISVDTAVAHLAGALGRPTWLLLPSNADFRWLMDREDCPWYPSMRIFRQPSRGDWTSVANSVLEALSLVFALETKALARAKL